MAEEGSIEDVVLSGKEGYIEKIKSFDYDADGQLRMYRRMSEAEAANVTKTGGLHTLEGREKQEIWLSTSLKHSRQFDNKAVVDRDDDVVIAFKVDILKFCDNFKEDDIIHQQGSGKINKGLSLENLKCLVHNEQLADHRWEKINFCLKGEENAKKFNKSFKPLNFNVLKIKKRDGKIVIYDPENNNMTVHSSESEERMEL